MGFVEKRLVSRVSIPSEASVFVSGEERERVCRALDHSDTGARLQFDGAFVPPNAFLVRLPEKGQLRLANVRWRHEDAVGVEFVEPESMTVQLEVLTAEVATLRMRVDNLP